MPPIQHFLYMAPINVTEPSPPSSPSTGTTYSVLHKLWTTNIFSGAGTLSNNDLSIEESATTYVGAVSSLPLKEGEKYYWEITSNAVSNSSDNFTGVMDMTTDTRHVTRYYPSAPGDVMMCAYDGTSGKFYLGYNGTWLDDPALDGTPTNNVTETNDVRAIWHSDNAHTAQNKVTFNFGASAFTYSPPAGYKGGVYTQDDYSIHFDGDGDYVSAASHADFSLGTGDFTVEYFIKFEDDEDSSIFDFRPNSTNGSYPHMSVNSSLAGTNKIMWYNSTYNIQSGIVPKDTWRHVAVCRIAGYTRMFVNGYLMGGQSDSLDYGHGNVYLGRDSFSGGYLRGNISNFRVIKGTGLYSDAFTPPDAPLASINDTVLLLGAGQSVEDLSGRNKSITINGNAFADTGPFDATSTTYNYTDLTTSGLTTGESHVSTNGHSHYGPFLDIAGNGATYYEIEVEVETMNATRPYIVVRLENNSANYIELNASAGSQLSVRRYVSSSLVQNESNLGTFAAGQRYKYRVYSSKMEFYVDDSLIYTYNYGIDYSTASSYRPAILAYTTGNTTFKVNASRYVEEVVTDNTVLYEDILFDGLDFGVESSSTTHLLSLDNISFATRPHAEYAEFEVQCTSKLNQSTNLLIGIFRNSSNKLRFNCDQGRIQRNGSNNYSDAGYPVKADDYVKCRVYPDGQTSFYVNGLHVYTLTNTAYVDGNWGFSINPENSGDKIIIQNSRYVHKLTVEHSIHLDGTGDYVALSDSSDFAFGSGDFTIEAFVYAGGVNSIHIFGSSTAATGGYTLTVNGANNTAGTEDHVYAWRLGDTAIQSTNKIKRNEWFHIAVCRVSGQQTVYINGVADSALTNNSVGNITGTSANIGYTQGLTTDECYISNMRVVKGSALYTGNFTVPAERLATVSGCVLLTGHKDLLLDYSNTAKTLTANGNAAITDFDPFNGDNYAVYCATGEAIEISDSTDFDFGIGSTPFTLEMSVDIESLSGYSTLFARGGGAAAWNATNGHQYSLYYDQPAGQIYFAFWNGSAVTTLTTSASIETVGLWMHVAVCYDGTTTRLFVGGREKGSTTATYAKPSASTITRIAQSAAGDTSENCTWSNLRVITGSALYTADFAPPKDPLTDVTDTTLLMCAQSSFVDAKGKTLSFIGSPEIVEGPFN